MFTWSYNCNEYYLFSVYYNKCTIFSWNLVESLLSNSRQAMWKYEVHNNIIISHNTFYVEYTISMVSLLFLRTYVYIWATVTSIYRCGRLIVRRKAHLKKISLISAVSRIQSLSLLVIVKTSSLSCHCLVLNNTYSIALYFDSVLMLADLWCQFNPTLSNKMGPRPPHLRLLNQTAVHHLLI